MGLPEFRRWISDRQADINSELDALNALETPRSAIFSQSASRITDRAVALAGKVTDPDTAKPKLQALIQTMLEDAFPAGLPQDGSPVSGSTSAKLFLNEALILLGLALKKDPSTAVRALLKAPVDALVAASKESQTTVSQILAVLTSIQNEPVGQGLSLVAADPRVDSLLLGLAQAKDGAERTLANLTGQQPVNPVLSQQIQAFLSSALQSLTQNTGNVDKLDAVTQGITSGLSVTLQNNETSIQQLKKNVLGFKDSYEINATGLSSDRVQISALTDQVTKLQDTVTTARGVFPELASFRNDWMNTIISLSALTRESRTVAAQSIFTTDTTLAADYQSLITALEQVPDTDLSNLTTSLESLRSLLLGLNAGAGFQDQYTLLLTRVQSLLAIYSNRLTALQAAVNNYPVSPSPLLDQLLSIVTDSKMRAAEDALKSGDIAAFMGLALGELNPVDLISNEVRGFLGPDDPLGLSKSLSDALSTVIAFETADLQASQGFEDARTNAIAALKDELTKLDNIVSVLDKAESQKGTL